MLNGLQMRSPTTRPQRHRTQRAELLLVLVGYLVAIFLLQGLAAAVQLGAGPLHLHREAPATVASLLFTHHDHAHASGERHHHAMGDQSVVAVADASAADTMTSALSSALSLLATNMTAARAAPLSGARHVQRPTPPWALQTAPLQSPYRPPRLA